MEKGHLTCNRKLLGQFCRRWGAPPQGNESENHAGASLGMECYGDEVDRESSKCFGGRQDDAKVLG